MDRPQLYARAFIQSAMKAEDESSLRDLSGRFLAIVKKRRLSYLLPRIMREIGRLLRRDAGTIVMSRFALDAPSRERVAAFLKKTFADFDEKSLAFATSESSLGGVSVRHRDFLYDATLDTAVAKLKAVWK